MPSKIAVALAEAIVVYVEGDFVRSKEENLATAIDDRLTQIREAYRPDELARCPIVSHHPDPCVGCLCAAMREFIMLEKADA